MTSPGLAAAINEQIGPQSPTMVVTVRACPQSTESGAMGFIAAFITWVRFMQSEATAGGIARHAASSSALSG